MKLLLILSLLLTITGCASRSIHEECSDPKIAVQYRDYNQCYSEVGHDRDMASQAKAERGRLIMQGWNAGLNSVPQKTTTHCTSDSFGNTVYTDCK